MAFGRVFESVGWGVAANYNHCPPHYWPHSPPSRENFLRVLLLLPSEYGQCFLQTPVQNHHANMKNQAPLYVSPSFHLIMNSAKPRPPSHQKCVRCNRIRQLHEYIQRHGAAKLLKTCRTCLNNKGRRAAQRRAASAGAVYPPAFQIEHNMNLS